MDEIAALFFVMSWIVALIDKNLGFNSYAETLGKGMADVAGGALVVGFARGILVVMTDGNILHTILHSCAGFLESCLQWYQPSECISSSACSTSSFRQVQDRLPYQCRSWLLCQIW